MKFNKITLENGLRILLVPQEDSLSTFVKVIVETGSDYEKKELSGVSHFLEHMCFKGTKKRPSPFVIASEFESIGASYNAYTNRSTTGFWAKARPEHQEIILDLLSDMYLNNLFDSNEIEKERGVILEELNMYEDQPQDKVWQLFDNLLYGDQPAGRPVLGSKEIIESLSREDLIKYHNERYVTKSTTILVAGKFDENDIVDKIKKYFGSISNGEKVLKAPTIMEQSEARILLHNKDVNQTHLVLGFFGLNVFDKRRYALGLMLNILGGGMSSRLFQKIREEMSAAYYVGSGASILNDYGDISINTGIENSKLKEVVEAIVEEVKKIASEKVSPEELNRAKEHVIGDFAISLETPSQWGNYYLNQEVSTRIIREPQEIINDIQKVTEDDILKVAQDFFKGNPMNLAAIGPFEKIGIKEEEIKNLLKL